MSSFKKCNMCKKDIAWRSLYWVCSVSTCNRKRVGLSFCSVTCWDAHLPDARHKEAWAEERRAPKEGEEEVFVSKPKVEAQEDPDIIRGPQKKPPGSPPSKPVIMIRKKTTP